MLKRTRLVVVAVAALTASFAVAAPLEAVSTVYTMTNAAAGNEILAFTPGPGGHLQPTGAFATGGAGTGGGLGNQGGVVLDPSDKWLFVVNAGDGTISVFQVTEKGLTLVDTVASGGFRPISLTVFRNWLYVLNAGDPADGNNNDNISGFRINLDGTLTPIAGATRPLSAAATNPAQVGFNRQGTVLLVTEKATNKITTYTVNPDGTANAPLSRSSALPVPFGFQFGDRDVVFITEANPGNPGALVSYRVNPETGVVSDAIDVQTAENAACWVALSNDQTIGYVTNTGSASVSLFRINFDGTMDSFFPLGRAAKTDGGPIDLVLTQDGRNLYTLNSSENTIRAFVVNRPGGLTSRGTVPVPAGANGLAAR